MFDPMTIGFLVVVLVVGGGGFMLYSMLSGSSPGILKTLGISTTSGILGGVASIFTDTYEFLTACVYGQLGMYGYLFLIGLAVMVGVWIYNGVQDYSRNRPISFVD